MRELHYGNLRLNSTLVHNAVQPPKLFTKFFKWYCAPELQESILGDLEEQFEEDTHTFGRQKARWRYGWNVLRFFRKDIIRPYRLGHKSNAITMLRHHLKLAFRGFKRFKTSFAINLIGLSSGLACALFIYLWVSDEWNMDKFHEKNDQLYQVMQNINLIGKVETIEYTPALLGESLLAHFPAVTEMTSVVPAGSYGSDGIIEYQEKQLKSIEQYASPSYFDVFSFPLLIGDKSEVLASKELVVLSERFAEKLFGKNTDPRGETIHWINDGERYDYVVSGVFAQLPDNTSKNFDVVFTLETFLERYPHIRDFRNSDPNTFVVLSEGTSVASLTKQVNDFVLSMHENYPHTFLIQKYSDRYLFGQYEDGLPLPGRMQYVKLFTLIAALVLLIACINFMNLSTARASRRLKEIGVKKAIGVRRKGLIGQFFTETFLLTFISIVAAFGITFLFLDAFNALTGKSLVIDLDIALLQYTIAVLLVTTLLAGSYPAFYLSGFKPIAILKGKLSGTMGDLWARKGLVILQYASSAVLITSVWIVSSQIEFIQNKHLGFDKEQVIYFNADGTLSEKSEVFIEELKSIPGVVNAAGFSHDLLGGMGKTTGLKWEGKDPDVRIRFGNLEVGYGLIETFGMEMALGRPFSKELGDNATKIILNEKAVEIMGLSNPIGQKIELWGTNREIIGVVKNFHFESLHEEIKPCFFQVYPDNSTVVIRIAPGTEFQTLEKIEALYQTYNPALSFNFQFFDREYDALYASEQQVASLSSYFAGIAIIISCLGLFGLVAFTAEKRQKEIGIRKVLGASVLKLVLLLSNEFIRTLFVAIIISLPVSYLLMDAWLASFVYRIDLTGWFFIGSGLITLAIAMITMSAQTFKAAKVNPVNSLKDE